MKEKHKKLLIILGGLVISAILVVLIMGRFDTEPVDDAQISPQETESVEIKLETPEIPVETEKVEVAEPSDSPEILEDEATEQAIQPTPEPAPVYTDEQLTNPDVKPNGEEVTVDDVAVPHEEVVVTQTPDVIAVAPPVEPAPPATNDNGEVYVPGFGNVENSGVGEVIYAPDMHQNGNKIGIME